MFNNIPHNDEETSFSEAYRSEILNGGKEKEKTVLPKLISILLLMIVVSVMSIFGYNYFTSSSTKSSVVTEPNQEQMSQDEERKKVKEIQKIEETSLPLPAESMMIDNIEDLEIIEPAKVTTVETTPTATKSDNDFDQIAKEMKLELSKELDKKSNTSVKKIESTPTVAPPQTQKGEEMYMKQLRELSKEINREAI